MIDDADSVPVVSDALTARFDPSEAERCPRCDTPRTGQFCEVDGYDFVAGPQAVVIRWRAVVTADRSYFATNGGDGVEFPEHYAPRTFTLAADEILIGRRSVTRAIEPDIDLSAEPEDFGISRRHAVLRRVDEGSYELTDEGSTNGTFVDDTTDAISPHVPVALADGTRIYLGTWTLITIQAVS